MKKITRIDMFANIGEVFKFWEWAAKQPPEKKTRADMIRLLGKYKKAEMYVDAHPERVEHEIAKGIRAGAFKRPKGEQK